MVKSMFLMLLILLNLLNNVWVSEMSLSWRMFQMYLNAFKCCWVKYAIRWAPVDRFVYVFHNLTVFRGSTCSVAKRGVLKISSWNWKWLLFSSVSFCFTYFEAVLGACVSRTVAFLMNWSFNYYVLFKKSFISICCPEVYFIGYFILESVLCHYNIDTSFRLISI